MKGCSVSYVIREMQMKTMSSIRAHCLLEWPASRTLRTPNTGENVQQGRLSFIAGEGEKWHSHFGKQSGAFFHN